MANNSESSIIVELENLEIEYGEGVITGTIETSNIAEINEENCSVSQCFGDATKICCNNPMIIAILWVFKRFSSLFLAIWIIIDMSLDVNQTYTFCEHAYQINGTYNTWALNYMNDTNSTYHHSVSTWYFDIACAVWITPPTLLSLFFSYLNFEGLCKHKNEGTERDDDFNPFGTSSQIFGEYSENFLVPFPYGKLFNFSIAILYLPIDILASSICIYVFIPLAALESGLTIAWNGGIDEDKVLFVGITSRDIPGLKLFEVIGEALPQIVLAIIFAANNYAFLSKNDLVFGIPIPTTLVSILFSFGSLMMGLYNGYNVCYQIFKWLKH